ncbi:hypothetical protein SDC9_188400 [bioreactor metagenome]|uniref:Uncharacterized protein n=1 Tax=bioreactor metagenome TaxID=1076179 RepID=A0A645HPU1_9ZZZZ
MKNGRRPRGLLPSFRGSDAILMSERGCRQLTSSADALPDHGADQHIVGQVGRNQLLRFDGEAAGDGGHHEGTFQILLLEILHQESGKVVVTGAFGIHQMKIMGALLIEAVIPECGGAFLAVGGHDELSPLTEPAHGGAVIGQSVGG